MSTSIKDDFVLCKHPVIFPSLEETILNAGIDGHLELSL